MVLLTPDAGSLFLAGTLCLAVGVHISSSIRFPKLLRHVGYWISVPFHNFLTLDDLDGPFESSYRPPASFRLLFSLALLESCIGLTALVYELFIVGGQDLITIGLTPALTFISWVSPSNNLPVSQGLNMVIHTGVYLVAPRA